MEPNGRLFGKPIPHEQSGLVSTAWLGGRLQSPHIKVIDATQFLPAAGVNSRQKYLEAHIPGAVFLELGTLSDPLSELPNTMPPAGQFTKVIGALGIGNDDFVVIYDTEGIMSAPRLWWMFRAFGHESAAVLDGGLSKWRAEGRTMESDENMPSPRTFLAADAPRLIAAAGAVQEAIYSETQIVDARSAERFEGAQNEPRAGLRSGHIPNSRNLPYTTLLNPSSGTMLSKPELAGKFLDAGVDLDRHLICTCGSGVTACVLALALHELGHRKVSLYDGSWTEWGGDPARPVETGSARFSRKDES